MEKTSLTKAQNFVFLAVAICLWAWFSFPAPQLATLYQLHQSTGPVVSVYSGTEHAVGVYYKQLILGATLLSLVGPLLIWLLPHRFTNKIYISVAVGFSLALLGAVLLVKIVSPVDPRVPGYPINSEYFILAVVVAGLATGYFRSVTLQPDTIEIPDFLQKFRFVLEGVLVWLFVSQIYVFWGLRRVGNVSSMGPVQLGFTVAALFWSWLCPLLLWKRRPATLLRTIVWAVSIVLVVSKIVGLCFGGVFLVLKMPGGFQCRAVRRGECRWSAGSDTRHSV